MDNRIGFAIYENVETSDIEEIIKEIFIFRYFVTEKLIVQVTFADPEQIFGLFSHIYISTYSETDPPVYLVLPQLLGSNFSPVGPHFFFNRSFITTDMLNLQISLTKVCLSEENPSNPFESPENKQAGFNPLNQSLKNIKKYSRAVMGGTFDHMHAGHLILLTIAASVTDFLAIGLTDAALLASKSGKEFIQPWHIRRQKVSDFLSVIKPSLQVELFPISDPVSKAGTEVYEAIILTTEVEKAFELVNEKRSQNNLPALEKVLVQLAFLDQGKISSTDVRKVLETKSGGTYVKVKHRWDDLGTRLGLAEEVSDWWWDFLSCQYSRKCRFYHTLQHIESILNYLEAPNEVLELSAFFHDLIYIPMKTKEFLSNEMMSVKYFQQFTSDARLDSKTVDTELVCLIIESTIKHLPLTDSHLCKNFLDLDLSILASPAEVYEKYSENIRKEYIWVSDLDFITGRKQVLETFLKRDSLFFTSRFLRSESEARFNIMQELSTKLSTSPNL